MEAFSLGVPEQECAVLEFPGYVKNTAKALEMFGGAEVRNLTSTTSGNDVTNAMHSGIRTPVRCFHICNVFGSSGSRLMSSY